MFWAQLAAVEPFPSVLSRSQLVKGHSVRQAPSRVARREIDSTPTRSGTQCTTKAPGVARPASFTHSQFDKFSLRHWVSLAHRHLPLHFTHAVLRYLQVMFDVFFTSFLMAVVVFASKDKGASSCSSSKDASCGCCFFSERAATLDHQGNQRTYFQSCLFNNVTHLYN